jgi:hypothetical protein
MEIKSHDNVLVDNIVKNIPGIIATEKEKISNSYGFVIPKLSSVNFEHPVDGQILDVLSDLLPRSKEDVLYSKVHELSNLWFKLVDKSIKCLRYFDTREPYLKNGNKVPQSYGIKELIKYYKEFADFEALLYGSNQFYRDHVIHLFRTWLIGLNILINDAGGSSDKFYNYIELEGEKRTNFQTNFFESVSVWTLVALCHDLGYPLEKFQTIINKTQNMMEYLVSQPKIHQDIAFSGTQDKINEFIVRMMSSKMVPYIDHNEENCNYTARVQSKYYIKYSKSLESYSHGIVSALIIYKVLLYFLESDFSFHDDYKFDSDDASQYYMRRDILRSIASHTCKDVYHMKSNTFPLLLIVSDELQEWGRKRWQDLYSNNSTPQAEFKLVQYDNKNIVIEFVFEKVNKDKVEFLVGSFYRQFEKFRMLFRDGEDTAKREFHFYIRYSVHYSRSKKKINVTSLIPAKSAAVFKVKGEGFRVGKDFSKDLGNLYSHEGVIERSDFSIKVL